MLGVSLDGKIAVVTGAGRGLGAAAARSLAEAGADVAVLARNKAELEAIAADIEEHGRQALPIAVDVTNEAEVEAAADHVVAIFKRVDVLVNNAGTGYPWPAEDESLEHWAGVIEINQTAVFHLCQLCGRSMLEQGSGVIVNVASILGLVASGQIPQISYTASKGAVVNMTRELAVQWARRGIRVNAIAPGWFLSEMTQEMFDDEGGRTFIRRNTPMGRPGELAELDGALLYLASDASSYTTGAILAVDGGWVAR